MTRRTLIAAAILFGSPLQALADNNPATGMYSPKLLTGGSEEVCSPPPTAKPFRFYATANCDYTCAGNATKLSGSRELEWDPEHEPGMFKGDGSLWATMTQRLSNKGKRACVEAAAAGCGRLDQVASMSYRGITSGAWNMPAQINCGPGQPLMFSPYDPTVSSALRRNPEGSIAQVQLIAEVTSDGGLQKHEPLPADCRKKISVTACFGDCLCDPDELVECPNRGKDRQWAQVLGTRKPPATRTIELCADALATELAKNKMSGYAPDVLQYYCEDYAWRTIFGRKPTGTTCSAYRGSVDCKSLL